MPLKFNQELLKTLKILSPNENKFSDKDQFKIGNQAGDLLKVSDQGIESPIGEVKTTLLSKASPLPDQIPDYDLLTQAVKELPTRSLNHVGFCYHVDSQVKEKQRLVSEISNTAFKLYEEPSNDSAKWYFIGDTNDPLDPMIEFLPVESSNDTFIDYWLPHIHIDIDTNLDENQIESIIYKIYDGEPRPFRVTVIDDVVYTVRTRLGIIDGINIFLDLSTNHRKVEFSRKNILKQL